MMTWPITGSPLQMGMQGNCSCALIRVQYKGFLLPSPMPPRGPQRMYDPKADDVFLKIGKMISKAWTTAISQDSETKFWLEAGKRDAARAERRNRNRK